MTTEGIINIFLALIFGIPSIIAIFRINQTKIVYLEKQRINLKDDLLKNFDDLSIKYKGIEVQQNIYFLSGFLVCQGKKDITNGKNNLEIFIAENSKWLDFKIVSNSNGMKVQAEINKNRAQLNFDLFKTKEYIEYEAIIEINKNTKIKDTDSLLGFHHRIPNIPSIIKFNIEILKSSLNILLVFCLAIFLPLFITYDYNKIDSLDILAFNANTNEKLDRFTVISNDNLIKIENQVIDENSGITLFIKGQTENFPVKLTYIDGKENTKITSVYFTMKQWQVIDWLFAVFLLLVFLFSIIGMVKSIKLYYYQKRYLRLISK